MRNAILDVIHWRRAMDLPYATSPMMLSAPELVKHNKIISEEVNELHNSLILHNMVEIADACGDIIYTVVGLMDELGIPINDVMEAIYDSNMSKLGADGKPIFNEFGKLMKGENFKAPDIAGILSKHYGAVA